MQKKRHCKIKSNTPDVKETQDGGSSTKKRRVEIKDYKERGTVTCITLSSSYRILLKDFFQVKLKVGESHAGTLLQQLNDLS